MKRKLEKTIKRYFKRIRADKWVTSTKYGTTYTILGTGFSSNISKRQTNYVLERERAMDYDDGYRIRKLTPVECERLQGFPDNWTKYGKDNEPISDTQRYKCCGNAVTTNVITAIINEMFDGVIENEDN